MVSEWVGDSRVAYGARDMNSALDSERRSTENDEVNLQTRGGLCDTWKWGPEETAGGRLTEIAKATGFVFTTFASTLADLKWSLKEGVECRIALGAFVGVYLSRVEGPLVNPVSEPVSIPGSVLEGEEGVVERTDLSSVGIEDVLAEMESVLKLANLVRKSFHHTLQWALAQKGGPVTEFERGVVVGASGSVQQHGILLKQKGVFDLIQSLFPLGPGCWYGQRLHCKSDPVRHWLHHACPIPYLTLLHLIRQDPTRGWTTSLSDSEKLKSTLRAVAQVTGLLGRGWADPSGAQVVARADLLLSRLDQCQDAFAFLLDEWVSRITFSLVRHWYSVLYTAGSILPLPFPPEVDYRPGWSGW